MGNKSKSRPQTRSQALVKESVQTNTQNAGNVCLSSNGKIRKSKKRVTNKNGTKRRLETNQGTIQQF